MVERRLGRGLDFFLSEPSANPPGEELSQVELSRLDPSPFQPRKEFRPNELEELAQSIRTSGVLQPILVRRAGERYEIIAGERRWRAAKVAGLERIPAVIRQVTDEVTAVLGLVENVQRADLNAIEKALALQRIQAVAKITQDELARQIGLERSTVTNLLRLLELPREVQDYVSRGTLQMGHARALLGIKDPKEQCALAEAAIKQQWTVRQVEQTIQQLAQSTQPKGQGAQPQTPAPKRPPVWIKEIEETLQEALGTDVKVRYSPKKSRILIECRGREEFERVYERLKTSVTDT